MGQPNRAGEFIDYKHPPTFIHSGTPLVEYKRMIFEQHVPAKDIPLIYQNARPFLILRPTGLGHIVLVEQRLRELGLEPVDVIDIGNFMRFADAVYVLDPSMSFTWKWRTLMFGLHATGLQNQNLARVYFLGEGFAESAERYQTLTRAKGFIRREIGNMPYLFFIKVNWNLAWIFTTYTHQI